MMNKPEGLLSATTDKKQKTVLDLLPEHLRRRGLFPVGRLDKDTVGFILKFALCWWQNKAEPISSGI